MNLNPLSITLDNSYVLYTDGGGNTGNGSWAYLCVRKMGQDILDPVVVAGKGIETTNNRMEMTAVINAISSAPIDRNIIIYTDSAYVKKGFHDPNYLIKWMDKGWRTSNKQPVKNQDLWEKFIKLSALYNIRIELVPGHSGVKYNELADKACTWILKNFNKMSDDEYVVIFTNDCKFSQIINMRRD